jgi:hypothetical protein
MDQKFGIRHERMQRAADGSQNTPLTIGAGVLASFLHVRPTTLVSEQILSTYCRPDTCSQFPLDLT